MGKDVFINDQYFATIHSIHLSPKPSKFKTIKCKFKFGKECLINIDMYNYDNNTVNFEGMATKFELKSITPKKEVYKSKEVAFQLTKEYSYRELIKSDQDIFELLSILYSSTSTR